MSTQVVGYVIYLLIRQVFYKKRNSFTQKLKEDDIYDKLISLSLNDNKTICNHEVLEFNNLAFTVCKQLREDFPYIQIFFNNNDYSIHDVNILFCCSDLTEKEKAKLQFKANDFINIFNQQNNNLYETYNLSKYLSFTLR